MAAPFNQPHPFSIWGRWFLAHFDEPVDEQANDGALMAQVIERLCAERYLVIMDNLDTLLTGERLWHDPA